MARRRLWQKYTAEEFHCWSSRFAFSTLFAHKTNFVGINLNCCQLKPLTFSCSLISQYFKDNLRKYKKGCWSSPIKQSSINVPKRVEPSEVAIATVFFFFFFFDWGLRLFVLLFCMLFVKSFILFQYVIYHHFVNGNGVFKSSSLFLFKFDANHIPRAMI